MYRILKHALLDCDMTILRNRESGAEEFRAALERVAHHLCIALCENLPLQTNAIQTPLQETTGYTIAHDVVLVPILRSGLTLLHSFTQLIPQAKIGYVGLKRDEETLEAKEYYCNIPTLYPGTVVIVLDPMLATGGSMCAALADLKARGAQDLRAACVLAAPAGIERVMLEHPDVQLCCAAQDAGLNSSGFIIPGLGDAGDRAHGTL